MKKFNNIPNPVYTAVEDGVKRYHSRSLAICALLVLSHGNEEYSVLVHKRGQGCPDEKGLWSFNCGYLDWNETLHDCLKRELWEEIGLDLDSLETCNIVQDSINDTIDGENKVKQNVTIRYQVVLDYNEIKRLLEKGIINGDSASRGGEPNEIEEIKIIPLSEKQDPEKWAFNHGYIFNSIHEHYYGKDNL